MVRTQPARRSGSNPVGGFRRVVIGVPLVGLLAAVLPLAAAALTVAIVVAVVAVAAPAAFVAVAAVLSTATPKAGYVFGGFPLPVMIVVLTVAALLLRWRADPAAGARHGVRLGVVALVWLAYRLIILRLDGGNLADGLALAGWFGLPVLLLLMGPALGTLHREEGATWAHRLETGMLLACAFSVLQQLFGLDRTAVPGLTRAVGADYSAKPLQILNGTKIPSTYQNGNVLGVITGFFFLIAAERVLAGRGRRRDAVIMGATALATILSGSRTAIVGLVIGMAALVLRSGLNRRAIAVFGLGAATLVGVLYLSPAAADRLLGTKISDPSLALRTTGWQSVLGKMPVNELATGGPVWAQHRADPGQSEGLVGAVQQVGLVGMVLLVGTFFAATGTPELRRWRLLLIPVVVSLVVDSAYLVFPTLFLPVARMFAPLRSDAEIVAETLSPPEVAPPLSV